MSQGKQKKYIRPQQAHTSRAEINAGIEESRLGEGIASARENKKKKPAEQASKIVALSTEVFSERKDTINIEKTLNQFDIQSVPRNAFMLCIASRRSGKSHIITHFLEQYTKKHETQAVFLMTRTNAGFDGIPHNYRYKDLEHLKEIIDIQIKVKKHNQKAKKKDRIKSNIIVVLDDMVAEGGMSAAMRKDPLLNKLSVNGRHLSSGDDSNMMVILISQVFTGLSPQIRLNADLVLTCQLASRRERENIVNSFLSLHSGRKGLAESYAVFDQVVNKTDFNFIAIEATKQNKREFKDYVYHFKAPAKLENRRLVGDQDDWKNNRREVFF